MKRIQVGFRLDDFHGQLLTAEARRRGVVAGRIALAGDHHGGGWTDSVRGKVLDEVAEVRQAVGRLRDALATAVVAPPHRRWQG